ncbi:helix-turn-helix domain-containing protein [Eubacteriaceae bacterium ES2]|nr:helix-turn-helix domain-containing protein [Eubacteriaceae bacterium ES2]
METHIKSLAALFETDEVRLWINNPQIDNLTDIVKIDRELNLTNPRLVYLLTLETFENSYKNLAAVNVLLASDKPVKMAIPAKINLLWIKSTKSDKIFKKVNDFFSQKSLIEKKRDQLTNAFFSGKGLQHLIDEAQKVFDNPMFISDLTFRILGFSKDVQITDPSWPSKSSQKTENYLRIQKLSQEGVFKRLYESQHPCLEEFDYASHPWLAMKIVYQNKIIGHVAIVALKRDFLEIDHDLLIYFAKLIGSEVAKIDENHIVSMTAFDHLIMDILNETLNNEELIDQQVKKMDLNHRQFHLLVLKKTKNFNKIVPEAYLLNYLKRFLATDKIILHQETILLFVDSRKSNQIFREIKDFLKDNSMKMGISLVIQDWKNLKAYLRQANRALELGQTLDEHQSFYSYQKLTSYDLLDLVGRQIDLKHFFHPAITELQQYDLKNNTDYVRTLDIYLKFDGNVTQSATYFLMHRNSMLYRIGKIEEITGLSLANSSIKYDLMTTFKIIQLLNDTSR